MIPPDYEERVYAGILGKLIGVYLGRPFEGWSHERILSELGAIRYYVHARLNKPLIVTDDDVSGTFTFLQALPDHGNPRDLSSAQIGQTWLNYIVERRTILWWGGLGNSTEHTAYVRLKHSIPAPMSGSRELNGQVVSEQIGAQIFIDGWAMVAPGDPAFAADLARRAALVSHDGEAVYAAQVIAAMEALAFVETDRDRLLDTAVSLIPKDSVISRLISDLRDWHADEKDWREARRRLAATYGYDRYGGNCHVVPNHGVVILGFLYGNDDFQQSLLITNTCGWDTDCNSGNVGCLLGIKNGLRGIDDGPDWRGPVADRLYLSTADGGRGITDAVSLTYDVARIGRALAGEDSVLPKRGARFHFSLPGSVQGFRADDTVEARETLMIENVVGPSEDGQHCLALRYRGIASGRVARAATATFIPPDAQNLTGYTLFASPTVYPGQTVRARVVADVHNARAVACSLYLRIYGANDQLVMIPGPRTELAPGADHTFLWTLAETGGAPIAEVGAEISSDRRADGTIYLDFLTWDGVPNVVLTRPPSGGTMWRRAWVDGVDQYEWRWPEPFRLSQNDGTGLLIQGTRQWTDYRVSTAITPHLVKSCGIAARVQGMRRYYALLLCRDNRAQLVRVLENDVLVLAETAFSWEFGNCYDLALEVNGQRITALVNGQTTFESRDDHSLLTAGGVALVCEEGRISADRVTVQPIGEGISPNV